MIHIQQSTPETSNIEKERTRGRIRPRFLLVLGPLLLGACVPLPLQVATLAADGISYMMTKKSVTDHGLSAVVGQDCALHRVVTEGTVCRVDKQHGPTVIAASEDPPKTSR